MTQPLLNTLSFLMQKYRWCCNKTPFSRLHLSSPTPKSSMEKNNKTEDQEQYYHYYHLPNPTDWLINLLAFQLDLIYNLFASLILSPIFALFSIATETVRKTEEVKVAVISEVRSTITRGTAVLLKKLGLGFIGAVYMCFVLVIVIVLAGLIGVGFVQIWVEEPVFVRERLYFDYTDVNPSAVFELSGGAACGFAGGGVKSKKMNLVPVGHTFYVSLVLLMPESDFNRDIGIFQSSAELLSSSGGIIGKSSQPCMLRFRSLPIRLTRTVMMGVPLVLGIIGETQTITIQMLKHKEVHTPRTKAIRVTLAPRAGTSSLPQLYEAEIIMISQLPWRKQLIYNWKWTLYVWTTLWTYVLLVLTLVCCFRPLLFPLKTAMDLNAQRRYRESEEQEMGEEEQIQKANGSEVSDALKRWKWEKKQMRRKATEEAFEESVGVVSAASSISISRDDLSVGAAEEDVGDSESLIL